MIFEKNYTVGNRDIGNDHKATNKAMLKYLENIACKHSDEVGYGINTIEETKVVWILLDWKFKVIERPVYGQTIKVRTWSRKMEKCSAYRDFQVLDEKENILAIATTKWVLLDANTRKNLTENANKEAKRILENAKRDADELIKNIRRTRKEKTEQDANRAMNEAMREINEKIKKREQSNILKQKQNTEIPKNLIAGNTVEILDIGQTGTVVSPPKADGSVVVQAGIMKIQTNITNLRIVNQAPQNIVSTGKRGGLKTQSVKSEVDLRGLMLEDALFVTDKYLDDAFFAGLNQVTVIHGKGTGVLRKGIHDMLRRHPHVKSFRLGTFGEGEAGVTVVELKR